MAVSPSDCRTSREPSVLTRIIRCMSPIAAWTFRGQMRKVCSISGARNSRSLADELGPMVQARPHFEARFTPRSRVGSIMLYTTEIQAWPEAPVTP